MRVFSNTAMSADGKIGTWRHDHVAIGSPEDRRWMSEARAMADAVLVGGATFRNWPLPLVEDPRHHDRVRESPMLNVVLTRRGLLSKDGASATRWPDSRVRLLILAQDGIDVDAHRRAFGATVLTHPDPTLNWALDEIAAQGCEQLLIEGGGDLIFQALDSNRLDSLYLTLCPLVIGGRAAPTPVDGAGFTADQIRRLTLRHVRRVDDELYLHYDVAARAVPGGSPSVTTMER